MQQLLAGETRSSCLQEIVKLRLCEKRLLQAASDHAREQREEMEREGESVKKVVASENCSGGDEAGGDDEGGEEPNR